MPFNWCRRRTWVVALACSALSLVTLVLFLNSGSAAADTDSAAPCDSPHQSGSLDALGAVDFDVDRWMGRGDFPHDHDPAAAAAADAREAIQDALKELDEELDRLKELVRDAASTARDLACEASPTPTPTAPASPSTAPTATPEPTSTPSGTAGQSALHASFRICGGDNAQTERAIEQLIAGRGYSVQLVSRSDGCADLTVDVSPAGGAASGRQSTNMTVSSGSPGRTISVRIVSENGATRASISAGN